MRTFLIFAIMLIAAAFLAGCAQETPKTEPPPAPEKIAPKVTLQTAPDSATEGHEFTLSWRVSGDAAQMPHTAVHYGASSVTNPAGPSDYPKATAFQCQQTPCSIPDSFSAKLKIDEPGTYYYRAHAIISGKNVWSEEKAITIAAIEKPVPATKPAPKKSEPKISITSAPALAGAKQSISISWKIESESSTTSHTAVHYGASSVTNPKGPGDYPSASDFICTSKPCSIPRAFQAQISITGTGTYYYRAHAIIDGQNIWSEEKTIEIVKPEEAPVTYGGGGGGGGY